MESVENWKGDHYCPCELLACHQKQQDEQLIQRQTKLCGSLHLGSKTALIMLS